MSHANERIFDHKAAREWKLGKNRAKRDKTMDLKEAVSKFVDDGDAIVETGFAYVRGALAAYWEIGRQKKKDLVGIFTPGGLNTVWHEVGGVEGCHVAYTGVEMRGLIAPFRRGVQNGTLKVYSDWSHDGLSLSFRAAEQGLNYVACKSMLGTDIVKTNPYVKVVDDPWHGDPVCLVPAIYPDVAIIHVHAADIYGNCRIFGPVVNDDAICVAARKVIITCESLACTDDIVSNPGYVKIPHYVVDAVCEVPYGAWPGDMPGVYYFDRQLQERIIRVEWSTVEGTKKWIEDYIYGTENHYQMIHEAAKEEGMDVLDYVKQLEKLAASSTNLGMGWKAVGAERDWRYEEIAKKAI